MTTKKNLIAEAHEHIDKAADAAPVSARQAILTGKVEDQRLSLVARLVHALEKVTAERDELLNAEELAAEDRGRLIEESNDLRKDRDSLSRLQLQTELRLRYVEGKLREAEK